MYKARVGKLLMFCQIQTSKLRVNNLQSVILISLEVLTNPNTSLEADRLSKFFKVLFVPSIMKEFISKILPTSAFIPLNIMFSRLVTIT